MAHDLLFGVTPFDSVSNGATAAILFTVSVAARYVLRAAQRPSIPSLH